MIIPHSPMALDRLCRRFGIRRLTVFGSVARGTPRPDSDIDLVVEFSDGPNGPIPPELVTELETIFGRPPELFTPDRLTDRSRARVRTEGVLLHPRAGAARSGE